MRWLSFGTVAVALFIPGLALAQGDRTDPQMYSGPAWSPYVVGALIGLLSMLTFYFSDKPLGASTAYACFAGMVGNIFFRRHTQSLRYFQDTKPKVEWEIMLLLGVIIGAFFSAWMGGEITGEWLPPLWEARFGVDSFGLRMTGAVVGGLLMAFGARLAGGCTSGHGISGTMQLSVGSWIAVVCFFASGIATVSLLFRL